MRIAVLSLFAFLLSGRVLAQAAPSGSSTLPPSLQSVHRIVCLGDSITQGGEGPGGYVWLLRHYLNHLYPSQNIDVINAGISGHKSNDMKARFQRDVLDRKPDLVTISVGVNDVWHGFRDFAHNQDIPGGNGPNGIPLPAYRANVEDMITRAQAAGAQVVVLSTTVIHENLKNAENARLVGYNAALRDLARRYHCRFVDYQKPFHALIADYRKTTGGSEDLLTVDGVHMNATGNRVMAHTLLTALGVSPEEQASAAPLVAADQRDAR